MSNDPYDKVVTDIFQDMSVTAGAGAGKTTALMKRYVNIITSGAAGETSYSPSDITAVTFTNRAANEMRERITEELVSSINKSIESGSEEETRFFKKLKDGLETAEITTLHALCTAILKEHPHEAGIDPEFTQIDANMSDIMLGEAIVECMQNELNKGEGSAKPLIHTYGFSGAVSVIKMLFNSPYLTEKVLFSDLDDLSGADDLTLRTINDLKDFFSIVKGRYEWLKRDAGGLDFNDLEEIARRVLTDNLRVRRGFQSRIKFLMVDEFQDTNPIQKEIIYLLSGRDDDSVRRGDPKRPYLFIVGDPKQSIYKFRNADVEIFNRVKRDIGKENALFLLKNFRSHKKIIDFINIFFSIYMQESENDFETDYEALLYPSLDMPPAPGGEPGSRVKCLFFDERALHKVSASLETVPKEFVKSTTMLQARMFEARLIADEIMRLTDGDVKVVREGDGELRAAEPGDIMILFSALTNVELYTGELKKRGIPFTVSSGTKIFNTPWVSDLVNILKAADNVYDDIALTGLMRSPFVLLSDSALFAASLFEGNSMFDKLVSLNRSVEERERLDELDSERLAFAFELLKSMRELKHRLKISEFIDHFMELTGYLHVMSARTDSALVLDDIRAFMEIAESVESAPEFSVKRFLKYIKQLSDLDAKKNNIDSTGDDGRVRIMSIHAAKGLESRVVFVADISRDIPRNYPRLILTDGEPPGVKVKPDDELKLQDTEYYVELKELEAKKDLAEYKRRLYVAATRAVDYLVFSGMLKFPATRKVSDGAATHWMDAFKSLFEIHSTDDIPKGDIRVEGPVRFLLDSGKSKYISVKCSVEFISDYGSGDTTQKEERFFKDTYKDNLTDFRMIGAADDKMPDDLTAIFAPPEMMRTYDYTVTMLSSFRRCKRLFYYKYVYGIPEYGFLPDLKSDHERFNRAAKSAIDPAQRGNIIHSVLERWTDYDSSHEPYLDIALTESKAEVTDDERVLLSRMLDNFVRSDLFLRLKAADRVMREVSFIMAIGTRRVTAKLDCLYFHDGSWRVLDYKTEAVTDINASFEKHLDQLKVYGLAAAANLGLTEITGEIFFLDRPEIVSREIDLAATEAELGGMITDIEAYDHSAFMETPSETDNCDNCGYRKICQCHT